MIFGQKTQKISEIRKKIKILILKKVVKLILSKHFRIRILIFFRISEIFCVFWPKITRKCPKMPFLVNFRIILAKKMKKCKKSKFCSVNFLDNTLKFILANFQPIWVIFAIFDSKIAFFAFFGKNHNFFQILLGFGSKTGFF